MEIEHQSGWYDVIAAPDMCSDYVTIFVDRALAETFVTVCGMDIHVDVTLPPSAGEKPK
jgi:hypothetical protein